MKVYSVCVDWRVLELFKENIKIVTHYYNNAPTSSSDSNNIDKTSSGQQLFYRSSLA